MARSCSQRKSSSRGKKPQLPKLRRQYEQARRFAERGDLPAARRVYEQLKDTVSDRALRALVLNDLASLAAVEGKTLAAMKGFHRVLAIDPDCLPARLNLALIEADLLVEGRLSLSDCRATTRTVQHPRSEESHNEKLSQSAEERSRVHTEEEERGSAPADQEVKRIEAVPAERPLQPEGQAFPKCLVLMITYNRLAYTKLAVDALLGLEYPALDVVVWDNASTDGTVEYLKDRLAGQSHVRLELSPQNRGVVYPMNAVWGACDGAELLAKLDNDTLVPPNLMRELARCHLQSSRFGVLSGFHFRKEGEEIAEDKNIVAVDGVRVFRQQYVGGCAVMIRRAVYEQVGPVPCAVQGQDRPFLESGWTQYQRWLSEAGLINGYPWPPIHVDHMEDTRSAHCVRTDEHQKYKRAMRGMSLEEFTDELCVWRPH